MINKPIFKNGNNFIRVISIITYLCIVIHPQMSGPLGLFLFLNILGYSTFLIFLFSLSGFLGLISALYFLPNKIKNQNLKTELIPLFLLLIPIFGTLIISPGEIEHLDFTLPFIFFLITYLVTIFDINKELPKENSR